MTKNRPFNRQMRLPCFCLTCLLPPDYYVRRQKQQVFSRLPRGVWCGSAPDGTHSGAMEKAGMGHWRLFRMATTIPPTIVKNMIIAAADCETLLV